MRITPVKRSTLPDSIIEQIKKLIKEGGLKPGDKLPPERELAKEFNVGRTTVRESLKALAAIGFVRKTREGTFISDNSSKLFTDSLNYKLIMKKIDFNELLEARKLLEVKMAGLAAERAEVEDMEQMEKNLEIMEDGIKRKDKKLYIEGDIAFHEAIAEAAQNRVLKELFTAVRHLLLEEQEAVVNDEIMIRSLKYHKEIFDAIKRQNSGDAEAIMFAHLDDVEEELSKKL